MYPDVLNDLVNSFKKLPGIGEKSAERYALSLVELSEKDVESFSYNLKNAKQKLRFCSICGHLTDKEICDICSDVDRDSKIICVVEDYKSVFMFEKSGTFKGKYHVLNGLISPMDGIYPEDINLSSLLERLEGKEDKSEVILALKPSVEGETTILYINKILEKKNIKVSRLSYGIPMGVDIDYIDSITLDRALLDRKEIS